MPTHTPGLWTIDTGAEGETLVTSTHRASYPTDDVCQVYGGNDDDAETREANARLIAAAPDLLEALRMVLPMATQYLASAPSHPDNAKLETARAAIAKAEGR